ncbi:MAG: hypothetical protein ABJB98_10490 [Actinomycetota bacterium]
MVATVLSVIGALLTLALFVGLFVWTRRTERDVEMPTKRQLTEDEANTLRLGIALSANPQSRGF